MSDRASLSLSLILWKYVIVKECTYFNMAIPFFHSERLRKLHNDSQLIHISKFYYLFFPSIFILHRQYYKKLCIRTAFTPGIATSTALVCINFPLVKKVVLYTHVA
jgi:hypothetical protein